MAERNGVEIDYCPQCRGVWLDRGELDKIIERSTREYGRDDDDDDYRKSSWQPHPSGEPYRHGPHKKKKGFLGELFDFD